MTIKVGDKLPQAKMSMMGVGGPEVVDLSAKLTGRKVVVFGLPGAFTGTCSTKHIPSFINAMDGLKAKGVEEVICVSVNDPFVLKAWGEATGSTAAGITHLGDADGSFTHSLGMEFTAPPLGLFGRSNRYAALVEDGIVTAASIDEPGVCEITTGDKFLDMIG